MARHDASTADCTVLTFKEGLLSAVAHDLEIRVEKFSVEIDDATRAIEARFDARSLRVVRAIGGNVSEKDRAKIEGNIVTEVLRADRFGEIRFRSTKVEDDRVEGVLTLCGRDKTLVIPVREQGGSWVAEVRLHQPDFGIKPYTAMLGTLRIQPDVTVRIAVPKSA
jgi:hypothetical protein